MSHYLRYEEEHNQPMVSYVEEWAPPQPPKRFCTCGTILSRYNPNEECYACQLKYEKER